MKNILIPICLSLLLWNTPGCKSTPDVPGVVETRDVAEGWDGDTLTVLSLGRNTNPNGTEAQQKNACAESAKATAIEIAWQKKWLTDGAAAKGRARYLKKRKLASGAKVAGIDYDIDFNCQAKIVIKK